MFKKFGLINLLLLLLLTACSVSNQSPELSIAEPYKERQKPFIQDNCGVGCPVGGSQKTLYRHAYTLNNNSSTRFANWVAYKVTRTGQMSRRPRNWMQDPDLPATDTLSPSAYKNASAELNVDRGHQAPLATLGAASDWESLNYLSNITPQKSNLNQGAWERLEYKERELVKYDDVSEVYVVTGPLFERHLAVLPGEPSVEIPSGYWKILFTGAAPDKTKGNYAAFIMDQNTPRKANFCDYQVTVDSIEKKTKPVLSVWSGLPEEISQVIKTHKGNLANEKLGCK